MSSKHGSHADPHAGPGVIDDEIDVRGIVNIGIWLAVTSVVSFAIGWAFYKGLSRYEKKALDARPSPIAAANVRRSPPGPRLQAQPERVLAAFRAREEARLNGWGWIDEGKSVAHVPVAKAIETVAAEGIPDFAPPVEVPQP